MCNLYSITTSQTAIIALFRVINRYVGNLPPMSGGDVVLQFKRSDRPRGMSSTPTANPVCSSRHPSTQAA